MSKRAEPESDAPVRSQILKHLKEAKLLSAAEMAVRLGVSAEAARVQLVGLEAQGLVRRTARRTRSAEVSARPGRPVASFRLTQAGENTFPKHYDELAVQLLDTLGEMSGPDAVRDLLAAVVERQVRQWTPRLAGLSPQEKLNRLTKLYLDQDPHMRWEEAPDGLRLIEDNCPYLNVAMERPALCSITVMVLSRLLGRRVQRQERFQSGHGRCVFVVGPEPVGPQSTFEFEEQTEGG